MKRLWLLIPMLAGCAGDATAPPTPGTLTIRLATPNQNDGAVVVVVSGGPVNTVHAAGAFEVARQTDGAGTHVLVVGDLTEGPLVTIDIPDRSRANAYLATLEQVADRTTFALLDPASYHLTIAPLP